MIDHVPVSISLLFGLTALLTFFLFIRVLRSAKDQNLRGSAGWITLVLLIWLTIQAVITLSGKYIQDPRSFPPAIMLMGVLPAVLVIIILFLTPRGRRFIDALPLYALTWIHVVRIPVELVLYGLYVYKCVPELMTFVGRNFDILAGISAPLMAYYLQRNQGRGWRWLLAWNVVSLILLMNIVISAVLAAPSPLQRLAFDQPNIAILYFPFSWLPVLIVPVVLFCHLAAIRQLLRTKS